MAQEDGNQVSLTEIGLQSSLALSVGHSLEPAARPKGTAPRPSGSVESAAFFPATQADAGMVGRAREGWSRLKDFYLGG